jgi:hypothetical protein
MFPRSRETTTRRCGYDFSDTIRRTCLRGVMPGVMYCGGAFRSRLSATADLPLSS